MTRSPTSWCAVLQAVLGGLVLAGCSTLQLDQPLVPVPPGVAPPPPLEQAWRREVDGGFGPEAPLVVGNVLIVGTARGELVALDRRTGQKAGSHPFGDSVEGALAVASDGRTVVVPVAKGRAAVLAYDARTGQERWRWTGGAVTGGVALVGDVAVASTRDGRTVGLDLESGTERWAHDAPDGAQIQAAPISLGSTTVLVSDDRGRLDALDARTGQVVWTADAGAPVLRSPEVADGIVVVPTTRGRLVALDAASGAIRWALDLAPSVRLATPSVADGLVVVGGTDGSVHALDAATGEARWTYEGTGGVSVRPLVSAGRVYIGTLDRRLVVLDAATGVERWSGELRGRVRGAPVAADGSVYLLTEPRHVVAFRTAPAVSSSTQ